MKIDNETEEEIDYNQTGGGGGYDVAENRRADPCEGTVPARSQSSVFAPCGKPPWTVTFRNAAGQSCTVSGITRPGTTLTVRSLSDCDVGQS